MYPEHARELQVKTVDIDGVPVLIVRERGHGDGGEVIRYFVDEGDGTYSGLHEWYSDPKRAQTVFDEPDTVHMRWVVGEARRQLAPTNARLPAEKRPEPLTAARIAALERR